MVANGWQLFYFKYVWFNDEDTLRRAGSKTDVYEAFKRMLSRGQVPSGIKQLLAQSTS